MLHALPVLVALLAVVPLATIAADRWRIPLPVLLALGGIGLAFLPGLPRTPLDPELILVFFLPPLLYADAFDTSWVDFRRWLRPILMLAVGLVAVTIATVGWAAHTWMPWLPWPVCFVLGAIVSPTDTVAVQAVLERLRLPRRITAIVGGESLVNDATGLVGVQIGVAVILSGAVAAKTVLTSFAWVAGGGIAVGVLVGLLGAWANRWVRGTSPLFALSLCVPYFAFAIATWLGSSGVLAVVVTGFIVAWRVNFIEPESRVDLYATWEQLQYVLNGLCFLFIGLETPHLLREAQSAGSTALLWTGLGIAGIVIATRLVWFFPAAYLPLVLVRRWRDLEGGLPSWRNVALASWCGVRGVVSLAAALALPATIDDGRPFPGRTEVLACTLCVILVTLLVQGVTLSPLIRLLGIRQSDDTEEEVRLAREKLLEAGIARLDEFCSEVSCPVSVHHLRSLMADELVTLRDEDPEARQLAGARLSVSSEVRTAVADAQNRALLELRDTGCINDNTYLELQLELDRERRHGFHEANVA